MATGGIKLSGKEGRRDLDILNYALTLEHLEAKFYVDGLAMFGSQLPSFATSQGFGTPIVSTIQSYFMAIRDHELQHVQTLIQIIQSVGGTPVAPCTYNFGFSTVADFVAKGKALENTGVMAYVGVIADIKTPELVTAGASIATVEARHAAYLNLLNLTSPFPSAFDMGLSMQQVLAIAGQFIVSCP